MRHEYPPEFFPSEKKEGRKETWFQTAPRPLMRWMTLFLVPYLAVFKQDHYTLIQIVGLAGTVYGIREVGKIARVKYSRYYSRQENYQTDRYPPFSENAFEEEGEDTVDYVREDFKPKYTAPPRFSTPPAPFYQGGNR